MTPPRFVAWLLVVWSGLAAVILEPAPWVLITGAGVLLLTASRRPATTGDTPPLTS
jgi:hypothetical protein